MSKQFFVLTTFFLGFLLLSNSCTTAQTTQQTVTGKIYEQSQVNKKAEFEGGKAQLFQFLSSNLEYPAEAIQKGIQGKVIVRLVVESNGTISNIETLRDIGAGCADEIIRGLQRTQGRWNSAKIDRKRVRSYYVLSINFKIPSDNSRPYIQESL